MWTTGTWKKNLVLIYIIKEKVSNDDFTGVFNNAMQQHERSNNAHKCCCGCQQEASIYD